MAASSSGTRPRSTASKPVSRDEREQRGPVRVADLPGRERLAGLDQLVAGGQHADPGPGVDDHLGDAEAGEHAEVARA